MSIQLSERAVKAIAAIMRDHLPNELATIQEEKRDFVLPIFQASDVFTYDLRERGTHDTPVRIEVFEDEATEIVDPEVDLGEQRVLYNVVVFVRATIYNSAQLSEANMWDARRRYQAGIVRVAKAHYEKPNGDVAITMVLPTGWTQAVEAGDEGIDSITGLVAITCSVEECPN